MFFFIGKLIMLKQTTLNTITTATTTVPVVSTSAVNSANAVMLPAPAVNVVIAPAVQTPAANTAPTAQTAVANTPMLSAPQAPAANTAPAKKITKAQAKAQAKADLDATIKNVLATGDVLAIKHTDYYDTYITKSNEVLSDLLTEIMEYAEMVFASSDVDAVIEAIRKKLKNYYNIKVQKNSNIIAIIVRYVTRTNRKNAHVYARAIKLAFDAGKTSAELAKFIDENGGVSKIREKNVNVAAVDLKEMQAHGIKFYTLSWLMDLAENNVIATFKVDEKRNVELGEMARGGYFNYMICKSIGNNEYAVIDAVGQVDDKFEEIMCKRFFSYKYSMYARCKGKDKADIEFRRRIKANIDKWNEVRKAEGRNLLNKYGYEIQNKKIEEENNEID
jgi:hypothetical protein